MILLEWACIFIAIISTFLALRLVWAWHRLRSHPHVEPIEIAKPSISDSLHNLVKQVASIADVDAPPIYIRRAALPNAFIVAGIFRSEIFLTDELLEQCSNIDELEHVICHEIAHIKHGDALPLGLFTLGLQCSQTLSLSFLVNYFQKRIDHIEHAADMQAHQLFDSMNRSKP